MFLVGMCEEEGITGERESLGYHGRVRAYPTRSRRQSLQCSGLSGPLNDRSKYEFTGWSKFH